MLFELSLAVIRLLRTSFILIDEKEHPIKMSYSIKTVF
jgi:hypothetical protein